MEQFHYILPSRANQRFFTQSDSKIKQCFNEALENTPPIFAYGQKQLEKVNYDW